MSSNSCVHMRADILDSRDGTGYRQIVLEKWQTCHYMNPTLKSLRQNWIWFSRDAISSPDEKDKNKKKPRNPRKLETLPVLNFFTTGFRKSAQPMQCWKYVLRIWSFLYYHQSGLQESVRGCSYTTMAKFRPLMIHYRTCPWSQTLVNATVSELSQILDGPLLRSIQGSISVGLQYICISE